MAGQEKVRREAIYHFSHFVFRDILAICPGITVGVRTPHFIFREAVSMPIEPGIKPFPH
jgi:hypothetical protein